MPRYVALLRGIMPMNPDHRMEKLRAVFEELGFDHVQSVIASGNIIFDTERTDVRQLEADIEAALCAKNGDETATIVRTKTEIQKLIAADPFKTVDSPKQHRPNVTFFQQAPDHVRLPKNDHGLTSYGVVDHAFCYTVDMASTGTPEAMVTLEREFGKTITTRTWGTVEKIWKKMQAGD